MGRGYLTSLVALAALAGVGFCPARAADVTHTGQAINTLEMSWFFDWTTAGSPILVVEQCSIMDITWSRGAAQGPSAVAPYFMQIYTSTLNAPLVVPMGSGQEYRWPVPFAPNTTFQICMFDSNGNTGGCQRTMTVIPNRLYPTPTCSNMTYPQPNEILDVTATDSLGPLSQFGWPAQCADLSFVPKNGSAPYTLTIAPTLNPPFNITVNSTGTRVNWTIDRTWGSSFFVGLSDSAGNSRSYGLLHAGRGTTSDCLNDSPTSSTKKGNTVSTSAVVGAGVGGGVGGLLLGLLIAFFIYRCVTHNKRRDPEDSFVPNNGPLPIGPETSYVPPTLAANTVGRQPGYEPWKESWAVTGEGTSSLTASPDPRLHNRPPSSLPPQSPPATETSFNAATQPKQSSVYVVHHDGGRPPVSVYAEDGTQVVELPPGYIGNRDGPPVSHSHRPSSAGRRLPDLPVKS